MKKVSVIMGVFNCKNPQILKKSINSVINQTYEDWELIICNDGSTDNTLQLLKEFEQMDSRIRVISYNQNQGLANALNQCIKMAEGMYIARQDDDDVSEPNRFMIQVKFLNMHPEYAIVGSNATVYDDSGAWGVYKTEERPGNHSFLWSNPFLHPTVMIRKEALLKVGCYRVAKETRVCEDYDLFFNMYAHGYKGFNIQSELYQYRIIIGNKKHRPMKYRIDEAKVRYKGYKKLGMLPRAFPYVLKPILIGMLPQCIFRIIRYHQYAN